MITIRQWEGQSLGFMLAPFLVITAVGLGLLALKYKAAKTPRTLFGWLGASAGLLYLGSGAIILTQMFIALSLVTIMPELGWIAVTVTFALMPIIVSIGALVLALRSGKKITVKARVFMCIIGIIALFVWAGLWLGPALAIVASVIPYRDMLDSEAK